MSSSPGRKMCRLSMPSFLPWRPTTSIRPPAKTNLRWRPQAPDPPSRPAAMQRRCGRERRLLPRRARTLPTPRPGARFNATRLARAARARNTSTATAPIARRCTRPVTLDQALSFAVIIGVMALFAWGWLRYDLVALLALLAALAAGIIPANKAFTGFGDDIVIIVGSTLLVSAAVARSGVIERVVRKVGSNLVTATQQVFALP